MRGRKASNRSECRWWDPVGRLISGRARVALIVAGLCVVVLAGTRGVALVGAEAPGVAQRCQIRFVNGTGDSIILVAVERLANRDPKVPAEGVRAAAEDRQKQWVKSDGRVTDSPDYMKIRDDLTIRVVPGSYRVQVRKDNLNNRATKDLGRFDIEKDKNEIKIVKNQMAASEGGRQRNANSCPICEQRFLTKPGLKRHIDMMHTEYSANLREVDDR